MLSPGNAAWRASETAAEMVLDRAPTSKELFLTFWEWLAVELIAGSGGVTSLISDGLVFFVRLARLGRSFTTAERFLGGITYKGNVQKWEHKTIRKNLEIYRVMAKINKAHSYRQCWQLYCLLLSGEKPIAWEGPRLRREYKIWKYSKGISCKPLQVWMLYIRELKRS